MLGDNFLLSCHNEMTFCDKAEENIWVKRREKTLGQILNMKCVYSTRINV